MVPDKEKEFDVAQAKITLKIEEVKVIPQLQPGNISSLMTMPQSTATLIQTPQPSMSFKKPNDDAYSQKLSQSPVKPSESKVAAITSPTDLKA